MIYKGMVCQWCGNTFTAQKSNTRYCSKRCADLANKQRMREMTQTIVDTHSSIKKERETARNESEILSPKLVAEFLGVSRSTAYDYIARGIIKATRVGKRKTFVKRSDIMAVFDGSSILVSSSVSPASIKGEENTKAVKSCNSIKGGKNVSKEAYTTVKAVAERYGLSLAGTDKILKSAGITVINHKGKHFYYMSEVEALFRKREAASHPEITEWYTSAEVQEKFKLKPATVYDIVSTYQIPSKKVRNVTYYSKIHFDMARGIKPEGSDLWYTVQEAMEKYGQSRDQVYNVLRYNNIQRVQVGRNVKFRRDDYDSLMRFAVKPNNEE